MYVKHGEATVGEDQTNIDFHNCGSQRNLSDTGRRQATNYGLNLRRLHIPICYPVQASPLCRAIDTAQLAFGWSNVCINPFWFQVYRLSGELSNTEKQRILDSLNMRLEVKPPKGCNRVIISHSFPEGIGLGQIPDMGTVIIRPMGLGKGYEVIGDLTLTDISNVQMNDSNTDLQ